MKHPLLLLIFLFLVALGGVLALTPTGTTNYTKYDGNPLNYSLHNNLTGFQGSGGEPACMIENNNFYCYIHRSATGTVSPSYIFFVNTTTPEDWNNTIRLYQLDGYSLPFLARTKNDEYVFPDGKYHLFVIAESPRILYQFVSTNKVNWTLACGGAALESNALNMAVYYHNDTGEWSMLLEQPGTPLNDVFAYNSTNGCDWTIQGMVLPQADNPWMSFYNDTYVIYDTYKNDSTHLFIEWWRTHNLYNNTFYQRQSYDVFAGLPTQGWEIGFGGGSLAAGDSELVTVPNASQNFFGRKFYHVYGADEHNYGLSYDADNRSFYQAHGVAAFFTPIIPTVQPPLPIVMRALPDMSPAVNVTIVLIVVLILMGILQAFFGKEYFNESSLKPLLMIISAALVITLLIILL